MNFTKILISWYSDNKRFLPWRETQNPYQIWLSEIILQQTQVKQGLPYYEAFVANFPTVFDLAEASEDAVLKLWQGLGYYSRARNLHHTARVIASEFNGQFPETYKELIALKGVGDYTASAIASICYDEACAVVDGNVYRVLARFFGIDTAINSSKGIREFKALAQSLLPEKDIGTYNQAVMEFGSRQCKPQNPDCHSCPLKDGCVALEKGKINNLPVKIKNTKIQKRYFNFLVFVSEDGKTILHQRQGKGIWQNLFQFPLVETARQLRASEFSENEQVKELINGHAYTCTLYNSEDIIHKLSHQHLHTKFWIISTTTLPQRGVDISEIEAFPVPILISRFIESFGFSI